MNKQNLKDISRPLLMTLEIANYSMVPIKIFLTNVSISTAEVKGVCGCIEGRMSISASGVGGAVIVVSD